ncbi:MAG: hypothetical protein J6A67_04370 [Clostridia bacterium]|nr:hypothetical protein [Clostridia bacterium]
MFGKLLKHDFIATGRFMGVVYGVFAVVALYLVGSVHFSGNEMDSIGEMLSYIVLCLTAFVNFILTAVVVMSNFQKTLYGEQGYLTFTLPVKSVSVMLSKTIVSTFWYIAAFICFLIAARIALWAAGEAMGETALGLIDSVLAMTEEGLSISVVIVSVIATIFEFFFMVVAFTMIAFLAITISNTRPFQKHYSLFSMLFMAVIGFVVVKLSNLISEEIYFGFNYNFSTEKLAFAMGDDARLAVAHIDIAVPIFLVIVSVVFFFVTHYLMKKKINIR